MKRYFFNPKKDMLILSFIKTRTKTSIRYAKENGREKRERKKGRRREFDKKYPS